MYPFLDLGFTKIPMYSLMMVLGGVLFLVVSFILFRKWERVNPETFRRLLYVCIPGAVVMYASAWFFNGVFHSIESGELKFGGITWLGGVVGSFPLMIFLIHKFVPAAKGNALTYFSLLVPGIVLAHALGRFGCFFAGCCYGGPTDSIFGVSFPYGHAKHDYPAPGGGSLPVLPTQLFEAVFEILLFAAMILFYKKTRKYNLEIYCVVYGIFRFIMEFFRGDSRGGTGFFLTPAQLLCVLMWIAVVFLILFRKNIVFKNLYRKCEVWQAQIIVEAKRMRREHSAQSKLAAIEALKELKKLYDNGVLTESEYESKRKELMKDI